MRLIPEWRKAWRMFSMQALALIAALPLVWAELPPEITAMVPASWRPWIMAALALGGMAGRLIDQRARE